MVLAQCLVEKANIDSIIEYRRQEGDRITEHLRLLEKEMKGHENFNVNNFLPRNVIGFSL
jgi:hypothetical protein